MPISISPDIPKWEAPEISPGIRDDLFPATVYNAATGEILLDPARVVLTTDRVYVFADAPQGVVCVLSQLIYEIEGDRWDGFAITLTDADSPDPGNTILVSRSSGCGCGSRLRAFRPFRSSSVNAS
jgi:hypothetical protein